MRTIHRALELGVDFFDTSDMYGPFKNERLLGEALRGRRDRAVIATKFGVVRDEDGSFRGVNGRPEYVRQACDASLARAHAVHPISALQSEYSLWTREPEVEILPTLRELGIGFVPYSPLGRGFLAGSVKGASELRPTDSRASMPRFQSGNVEQNLRLTERLQGLAAAKGIKPGQLALAWVFAQGSDLAPIPGTKRRTYLEENVASLDVALTQAELAQLDAAAPRGATAGGRYAEWAMLTLDQ